MTIISIQQFSLCLAASIFTTHCILDPSIFIIHLESLRMVTGYAVDTEAHLEEKNDNHRGVNVR